MSYVYASRKLPYENVTACEGFEVIHTDSPLVGAFEVVIEVNPSHFAVRHNIAFLTYDTLAALIDSVPDPVATNTLH